MGKNPGRPASHRPAGLAHLHTVPRLRSRGNVTCSNASESRIGCRFDQVDRKACTRIKGPTTQCKVVSKSSIHLPGRSQAYKCNVGATEGREEPEGGRPASPRQASLARARVHLKQLSTTFRRKSEPLSKGRWPRGHIPRRAGLGEAGRPHLAATQALASRGRQAHRLQPLTTDATCFTCSEPTLEGYK